jgi:flagellar motor switch protein FliN/FliY
MDIMVNGCLIAKGEVVVAGETFGIRITAVVSPEERIKSLR